MPSLHCGLRQILPLCLQSCPRRSQVPVHVGRFTAWLPRSRRAAGAQLRRPRRSPSSPAVRQVREARVADHVAALVRGQGQLRREALLHQSSSLIMRSSHVPEDPGALVARSRSSGPLAEAALLDTCSLLQPAQFFVRKRSSEKSEARRPCPSRHRRRPRHSAARGREGAAQALAVQRARGGRPGDRQRGARERAKLAVNVPVVAHRGEVPGVGRVVGQRAARRWPRR